MHSFASKPIVLAAALTLLLAPNVTDAQQPAVTGTLRDPTTGLSVITVAPNGTFQLRLQITTNFVSGGITYFLQSTNGSGFFRITGRDVTGTPFPNLSASNATAFAGNAGLLDPVNDFDLGGINPNGAEPPPGTYTIGTLTLSTLNAPLGQYTITTDSRSVVTDRTGGGFEDRPFFASATVIVIPEPGSVALCLLGAAGIALCRRFRG